MRSHTLPSGEIVELEATNNGNPPGVLGMTTAHPAQWLRIDGGPWERVRGMSQFRAVQWLDVCDDAADVREVLLDD